MDGLWGAVVAATVFAVFVRPFSDYHYWFSWSRRALVVGVLIYLLLGGAAAGGLGWLAGVALVGNSPPSLTFDAGHQLRTHRRVGRPCRTRLQGSSPLSRVSEDGRTDFARPFTLLELGTTWTFGMIDVLVDRAVERWFRDLTDRQLLQVAAELAVRIQSLEKVPDSAKKRLFERFVPAMTTVRSGSAGEKDEARILLIQFAWTFMQRQRWAKPRLRRGETPA